MFQSEEQVVKLWTGKDSTDEERKYLRFILLNDYDNQLLLLTYYLFSHMHITVLSTVTTSNENYYKFTLLVCH